MTYYPDPTDREATPQDASPTMRISSAEGTKSQLRSASADPVGSLPGVLAHLLAQPEIESSTDIAVYVYLLARAGTARTFDATVTEISSGTRTKDPKTIRKSVERLAAAGVVQVREHGRAPRTFTLVDVPVASTSGEVHPHPKAPGIKALLTRRGERCDSPEEWLVACLLDSHGLPYLHDVPYAKLIDGFDRKHRADFVLTPTLIVEVGALVSPEYRATAAEKLTACRLAGIDHLRVKGLDDAFRVVPTVKRVLAEKPMNGASPEQMSRLLALCPSGHVLASKLQEAIATYSPPKFIPEVRPDPRAVNDGVDRHERERRRMAPLRDTIGEGRLDTLRRLLAEMTEGHQSFDRLWSSRDAERIDVKALKSALEHVESYARNAHAIVEEALLDQGERARREAERAEVTRQERESDRGWMLMGKLRKVLSGEYEREQVRQAFLEIALDILPSHGEPTEAELQQMEAVATEGLLAQFNEDRPLHEQASLSDIL